MKYLLAAIIFWGLTGHAYSGIDAGFDPPGWRKFEGDHFMVLCPPGSDEDSAHAVLDHAEDYYRY